MTAPDDDVGRADHLSIIYERSGALFVIAGASLLVIVCITAKRTFVDRERGKGTNRENENREYGGHPRIIGVSVTDLLTLDGLRQKPRQT